MDKAGSSKVIMNKEQLFLFVENKRKEESRRDLELSMDKTEISKVIMSKEDSRRVYDASRGIEALLSACYGNPPLPVETESDLKFSKVIMSEEEEVSRGIEALLSAAAMNSKKKMFVEPRVF